MWKTILKNIFTLGIPAIIDAVARNKRAKREQEARLKQTKKEKSKNDTNH